MMTPKKKMKVDIMQTNNKLVKMKIHIKKKM